MVHIEAQVVHIAHAGEQHRLCGPLLDHGDGAVPAGSQGGPAHQKPALLRLPTLQQGQKIPLGAVVHVLHHDALPAVDPQVDVPQISAAHGPQLQGGLGGPPLVRQLQLGADPAVVVLHTGQRQRAVLGVFQIEVF